MTRPKDQFALSLTWGELALILKIRGLKAFIKSLFPFWRRGDDD